ncbi:ABC transporter substrate-binding protein [Paenibacillus sp. GSMTC-2017]|uniref:ABC transporter substrate-binding protein n=1 Tax=Paenibacillus sp. GSMTC-2017 TaxID=2794350 RepID=UPI0018D92E73|nr:ABC transporter substrate-binding protein [Paenibacillus sp. GSMTC-2017]MBH5316501.1 ABC transporter substrate-binding protein [Paenibacillus sp. GSMTC-2017]
MKANRMTTMKTIMSILLIMMMMFLAACGGNTAKEGNKEAGTPSATATTSPSPEATKAPETAETIYPLTVKDATGTEVTFEKAPTAIVTLVASETETIFAVGAGANVVGVDQWSNYPEAALSIAKIGDMTTNIEAVTALNPDLILANSSMNTDAIAKLRELNLNVYASDPKTYDAVIAKVEEIGKIVNKQAEANKVATHMNEVKTKVTDAVKDAQKKKVYLEFSPGWTVGSGEFLDELLTLAGGQNIAAAGKGWFEVNAEDVITQNPQVIIYPNMGEAKNSILTGIEARPGWEVIDAVKNKQLFEVTQDPLVRVGPRLADGLLEMAKVIHPELIK